MNLGLLLISRKSFYRILSIVVILLFIPLIAMQFTSEVSWAIGDFIVGGLLLFLFGYSYEIFTKIWSTNFQKAIIGIVVLIVFIFIWSILAVDLI